MIRPIGRTAELLRARSGAEMYANDAMAGVASAGIAANGVSLIYTENFGKGDVRGSHGWQAQVSGLEVSYDNLAGYSASFQAASAMFDDTNLRITSSLTWSEKNGFNGSASYNFLSDEDMAKEAAKDAQKGAQKNQGNLFLNIMDGLGFNLGGQEGKATVWDNIKGAFSGAWNQITNPMETLKAIGNGFSKLGKGIAGLASSAWDSVSGFVSETYNKMFGGIDQVSASDNPLLSPQARERMAKLMIEQGRSIFPTENPDFVNELQPDGSFKLRQRTASDNLILTHTIALNDPNHENITLDAAKIAGFDATMDMIRGVRSNDIPEGLSKFLKVFAQHGITGEHDGSLTGRSHFGDLQELHAMADERGIEATKTKSEIVSAIVEMYKLTTAKDDQGNFLLPQSVRDGLIGSALHIIQDSFAQGHVWRNESGQIIMFQTYEVKVIDTQKWITVASMTQSLIKGQ